jgi:glutathione S-transferase
MTDTFILYGSPHSQFTYKVALMLRLCDAPFAFRYISFRAAAHRAPDFLALNPLGQVPVLRHGERVLRQSAAILLHLAESFGRFDADDAAGRQRVREWLFWDADRLGSAVYRCHGFELGRRGLLPRPADPVLVAHYQDLAGAAFAGLDAGLEGRRFLLGETPTIADIACFGETEFAAEAGLDLARHNAIAAWTDKMRALPGYRAPLDLLPMADARIG